MAILRHLETLETTARPDAVWRYFTSTARAHEWRPWVIKAIGLDVGPDSERTIILTMAASPLREFTIAFEPLRRFALTAAYDGRVFGYGQSSTYGLETTVELQERWGGTRVEVAFAFHDGSLLPFSLHWFAWGWVKKRAIEAMKAGIAK